MWYNPPQVDLFVGFVIVSLQRTAEFFYLEELKLPLPLFPPRIPFPDFDRFYSEQGHETNLLKKSLWNDPDKCWASTLNYSEGQNRHKVKCREFCLNIRKHIFYCEGDKALAQVIQGGCDVSTPHIWRYSKAILMWSWATGSAWPCLNKGGWKRSPLEVININCSVTLPFCMFCVNQIRCLSTRQIQLINTLPHVNNVFYPNTWL